MSEILDRLRAHRVKVSPAETQALGTVYFRDPSGTDWVRIQQLFRAVSGAGSDAVPGYLIVPLLMCEESGDLVFDNYDEGVAELSKLTPDALRQLTDACLDVTGIGALLRSGVETAEKNSSASPSSVSPTVSPLN